MNKTLKIALLGALTMGAQVQARRIFAPLDVQLLDPTNASKYLIRDKQQDNYNVEVWGLGFARSAGKTYDCCGSCKVPLTRLFVGKDDFTLGESFPGGVANIPGNPWVDVTVLSPRVHFDENGAVFGVCASGDVTIHRKTVRTGVRARLPISTLTVERECDNVPANSADEFNAVRHLVTEMIPSPNPADPESIIVDSFAYRLDFLSRLLSNNTTGAKLVAYARPVDNHFAIGGLDCTKIDATHMAVYAIRRADGVMPDSTATFHYAEPIASVTNALPITGVVGADDNYYFAPATNYSGAANLEGNVAAQRTLFIAPGVVDGGAGTYILSDSTLAVRAAIEHAINKVIASSATGYMADHFISLGTQRLQGLGDLSLQWFAGCDWRDSKFWTEAHLGAVLPTGKKAYDPLKIFAHPLGNNGHFEVEPGFDFGWNATSCVALHTDLSYHWVIKHPECIAADFTGATIKNVGPATQARIKWQYLLFDADMSVTEPAYHQFGFNFGYNLYYKRCDNVCFCNTTVKTFENVSSTVDNCIPTALTRVLAHKLRGSMFYTLEPGAIFGGFSYIFAGKNTPQEIGWHLGMMIEF